MDEQSAILIFEIPDSDWRKLKRALVSEDDDFKLYGGRQQKYSDFEILEGPWAFTHDPVERQMEGAWQYKFNERVYAILNVSLRKEGAE